jgi:hypothetical protein
VSHSRYHCTTVHIKSSNHTLSLHRPTFNSSLTTNFPWLSYRELTRSADCLQDNSSTRTLRKTPSFVKNLCLQLRCLAIDVLLFRAFAWREPHRKHSFPYILVSFLWMGVYRSSHRNGRSFTVACIRCCENIYRNSSIVIETAHILQCTLGRFFLYCEATLLKTWLFILIVLNMIPIYFSNATKSLDLIVPFPYLPIAAYYWRSESRSYSLGMYSGYAPLDFWPVH